MQILTFIRDYLKSSRRFHLRGTPVSALPELIGVIDRFLDGKLAYPLEWDDFVSWKSENPGIEDVRLRIADLERDFLSARPEDRASAVNRLTGIRNEAAAFVGLPPRE